MRGEYLWMWQAGSVVHKENRIDEVGSSRPQNPTTTSPSRHTWHYATFATPSGLGGRGAMALGDGAARDLPARVYYTLHAHTHSTPSTPAVVARALPPRIASSITLGWPTDVILALALAISHPLVARPPALHINAVYARVNIWMRISMPDENNSPPPAPTFHFLHRTHHAILTFVSQQDLFHSETLEWIYDFEPVFFPLIVYDLDFCKANSFFRHRITILEKSEYFAPPRGANNEMFWIWLKYHPGIFCKIYSKAVCLFSQCPNKHSSSNEESLLRV